MIFVVHSLHYVVYQIFNKFNSNPRRIVDDLHFFCKERGLIIAGTAENVRHDYDKMVTDLGGWIVTLPSYMMAMV